MVGQRPPLGRSPASGRTCVGRREAFSRDTHRALESATDRGKSLPEASKCRLSPVRRRVRRECLVLRPSGISGTLPCRAASRHELDGRVADRSRRFPRGSLRVLTLPSFCCSRHCRTTACRSNPCSEGAPQIIVHPGSDGKRARWVRLPILRVYAIILN